VTSNLFNNFSEYDQRDYRRYLSAHLQYLNGLCELSIRTINNSINEFLSSFYVTTQLTSANNFYSKLNESIRQIQSNSSKTITNYFLLIESINHVNGFVSTYGTNYEYDLPLGAFAYAYLGSQPRIYDNSCSCQLYSNCTSQAKLFSMNSSERISLNGLKIGCLPSQSFHLSTLECFYDKICLNLIEKSIRSNDLSTSLLTKSSRFPLNTTITELLDNMFIEQLKTQQNYSLYFKRCSPSSCSYTYVQYIDLVYTITYLLGLQGGLSIVLKWISPKLIRIIYSLNRYRKRRTNCVQIQSSIDVFNSVIDQPSVSRSKRNSFLSLKSFSICFSSICLLTLIILFSIYIKSSENEITTTTTTTISKMFCI